MKNPDLHLTGTDLKQLETFKTTFPKAEDLEVTKNSRIAKKELVRTLEKPIVADEIRGAIERKTGKPIVDYIGGKIVELLEASEEEMVPLMEDLKIDNETIYREVIKNGKKTLIPEQTPMRDANGKQYLVMRKKPNFKVRKDALEVARKILVAEPAVEKNVTIGMDKDTIDEINQSNAAMRIIEEKARLIELLEQEVYGNIQDAEFTEGA